jgi:hypothetical protein
MSFCTECGSPTGTARYCAECGCEVSGAKQQQPQQVNVIPMAVAVPVPEQPAIYRTAPPPVDGSRTGFLNDIPSDTGCCGCRTSAGVPQDRNFKADLKLVNAIDFGPRTTTNPIWAGLYVISLLAWIGICGSMISSSHSLAVMQNGKLQPNPYWVQKSKECLGANRRLDGSPHFGFQATAGVQKDWDMWGFFNGAPDIPAALIGITLVVGIGWVALLKAFAVPIVFATQLLQVAMYVYFADFM